VIIPPTKTSTKIPPTPIHASAYHCLTSLLHNLSTLNPPITIPLLLPRPAPNSPPPPLHLPNSNQSPHNIRPLIPTPGRANTDPRRRQRVTITRTHVRHTHIPNITINVSLAAERRITAAIRILVEADAVAFDCLRADAGCSAIAGTAHTVEAAGGIAGPRYAYAVDAVGVGAAGVVAAPAVEHVVSGVVAAAVADDD
jgi:hypothetical protein